MVELTRIITIEVTGIKELEDETDVVSRDDEAKEMEAFLRSAMGTVDDVHVKVQDFVADKR